MIWQHYEQTMQHPQISQWLSHIGIS